MQNKRWIPVLGYFLLGMVAFVVQEFVLGQLEIFGVSPSVWSGLVAAVAVFEGGVGGAVFGLFAGMLSDTASITGDGFFTVFYMLAGGAIGMICEYMFRNRVQTALLWSLLLSASSTATYSLFFFLIPGRAGLGPILRVAIPEVLLSAVTVLIFYYPVKLVGHRRDD